MKKYSDSKISELLYARKQGASIPELVKQFGIPKTTIWHHIHSVELDPELKKRLRSRQGGSTARSTLLMKKAEFNAIQILDDKLNREIAIMGSMIYWAEGSKAALVFTNTDATMHRLFLTFLKNCFDIERDRCHFLIRIAVADKKEEIVKYWSNALDVPLKDIYVNIHEKQNKTKTQYGICRITVRKGGYVLRVVRCMVHSLSQPLLHP